MNRYVPIADELRAAILGGQIQAGYPLPSENALAARHHVGVGVIRRALAVLRAEGLIDTRKGSGTYVRDRRAVRLALSQYGRTLHPGPPGPFKAAAEAVGLVGGVRVTRVERRTADAVTATRLDIDEGETVVVRVRHMTIGDTEPEIVQISTSTIPLALIEGSPLAADAATRVYAAFVALGITPTVMDEEVSARLPTPDEAEALKLGQGRPVLAMERITRDSTGRPIELVHAVASDRITLVYDELPITSSTGPKER